MTNKSKIKAVALGGIFTALSVVFMFLSTFMPFTYIWVMLAGFVLAILSLELGQKYTVTAYVSATILSFFLVPSLIRNIEFAIFYGLYASVLLPLILKAPSKKQRLFFKVLVFAIYSVAMFSLGQLVFGIDAMSQQLLERGQIFLLAIIAISTLQSFVYDYFLSYGMKWYQKDFRKRVLR